MCREGRAGRVRPASRDREGRAARRGRRRGRDAGGFRPITSADRQGTTALLTLDETGPASGDGGPARTRGHWWAAGLSAAAAALVFVAAHDRLTDDALITLSYARTLGLHGEWGMIPGIRSNSQTSPLNALLMGGLTAVVRSVMLACGLLWVASMAAVGGFTHAVARRLGAAPWAGAVAGVLLAGSPLMASTIGLESSLAAALMAAAAWGLVDRRVWVVGPVAGLFAITRPDLAVFAVVAVLLVGRSWWRAAGAGLLVVLPWCAFAWYVLGSLIPDSFMFKTGTVWLDRAGGDEYTAFTMLNGPLLYLHYHPVETVLSLAVAAAGIVGCAWLARSGGPARRVALLLGVGSLLYWLALVAVDPGPCHWYYAPPMAALGIGGVLAAASVPLGRQQRLVGAAVVLVLGFAVVAAGRPFPVSGPEISPNYATAADYAAIAAGLPDGPVASPGEIGALAYHCDGRCVVLDPFSDEGLAAPIIRYQVDQAGDGLVGALLRWNYTHYDPAPPVEVTRQLWFRDGANARPTSPPTRSWQIGSRWHPDGEITLNPVDRHPWIVE